MTSAESQIEFIEVDYSEVQADYEEALKSQEKEEKRLSLLLRIMEGDDETLDVLIKQSTDNVSNVKKKIERLQDDIKMSKPSTAQEPVQLEPINKEKNLTGDGESTLVSVGADKQLDGETVVKVKNGYGFLVPSRKKSASGGLNTNNVQTLGTEANSTHALSTGAPPGCDVPPSKCLEVGGVRPPPTSLTEESNTKDIVEELPDGASESGRSQYIDVDINDIEVIVEELPDGASESGRSQTYVNINDIKVNVDDLHDGPSVSEGNQTNFDVKDSPDPELTKKKDHFLNINENDIKVNDDDLHDGPSVSEGNQTNFDVKDSPDPELTKKKGKKDKTEKKKKQQKESKKNKKEKKNGEKAKSTKVHRGFLSCFFCCFGSQERREDKYVIRETAV